MLKLSTTTAIAVIHCCSAFLDMETFYWNTELPLATNTDTMNDFLDNYLEGHCGSDYKIIEQDGTYAEIEISEGTTYGVHASGNGDFCTHKVEFDKLSY